MSHSDAATVPRLAWWEPRLMRLRSVLASLPAWPFLAGAVLGFAACCVAGRLVSQRTPFHSFVRFHQSIQPQHYFYPTASQLIAQVRNTVPAGKTPVIIGGASYLRGTGQNARELWSLELQRLLGERYVVFNFAIDQAYVTSFAAVVFAALAHEYPDLIYVANASPLAGAPWDGGETYQYLFWDAYYKGLLPPSLARNERIRSLARAQRRKPGERELHLGLWLDQFTYARDWWTYVGYEYLFTVWSDAHHAAPLRARRQDQEGDVSDLADQQLRLRQARDYAERSETNGRAASRTGFLFEADGTSRPDAAFWDRMAAEWRNLFPEELHGRCFLVLLRGNPHFMQTFSADDRRRTELQYEIGERMLERDGYRVVQLGANEFTPDDFLDAGHLMPSGGYKLARAVAMKVDAIERANVDSWRPRRPPSGALQIEFSPPVNRTPKTEPLVTIGPAAAPAEILSIEYRDGGRARLGYRRDGSFTAFSPEFALPDDQHHTLRVSLPGLYPDSAHSAEVDLSQTQLLRLKDWCLVQLDGKPFWEVPLVGRDTPAGDFRVGRDESPGAPASSYSGIIHQVERLPYPPKLFSRDLVAGARLRLTLSPAMVGRSFPLATTGVSGTADVLFLRVGADGRVTFGYDHWASPPVFSREIALGLGTAHSVEFTLPALAAEMANARELSVRVDGTEVWRKEVTHFHAGSLNVFFGRNPIGATTAEPVLEGGQFEAVLSPSWQN